MSLIVSIRPAIPPDIPEISRLFAASWRSTYRGMINDAFLDSIQDDRWVSPFTEGMKSGAHYIVAEVDDGKIAGATCVRKSIMEPYPDDGELAAIYIHPDYICNGIGSQLLDAVESYLAGAGYRHYILEVLPGNQRALRFYLRHGFQQTPHSVDVTLGEQVLTNYILRKKI